jgi:excisionase family DNA binding protein
MSNEELLSQLREFVAVATRQWLTVSAAAQYSGLSVKTIRNMLADGTLEGRKPVKGRVLISRDHLEHVIATSPPALHQGMGRIPKGRGRRRQADNS